MSPSAQPQQHSDSTPASEPSFRDRVSAKLTAMAAEHWENAPTEADFIGPRHINEDFRCAPRVPVRRQAKVIVPAKSACGPGSMFDFQMQAGSEKPAEDRAVLNIRSFARKARAAEKEAARVRRENIKITTAAAKGIVLLPKPKKEKAEKEKKTKKERTAEERLNDEKHQQRRNDAKDLIIQHFTTGFTHVHERDGQACGEIIADFSEVLEIVDEDGVVEEVYKRTLAHPFFAYYNAIMPKAHHLKVGRDKGFVKTLPYKGLALFQPYNTQGGNGVYGCIAVELDTDYSAVEKLCRRLSKVLPAHMMPTFAVGRWIDGHWMAGASSLWIDGVLARPHLIWMLAEPVYWNPPRTKTYKSGRTVTFGEPTHVEGSTFHKAKLLIERVGRGLTKLLIDLGADPAQTNMNKFKNPLSTYMSAAIINGDNLHHLQDFRRDIPGFDMDVQFDELPADVEAHNNQPSLVSQPEFVDCVRETSFVLNNARRAGDIEYIKACRDKSDLEAWIVERTMPTITKAWGNTRKVQRLVRASAKRFATTHNPAAASKSAATPKPDTDQPKKKKKAARGRYRNIHADAMPENTDGVRMTWTARKARADKLKSAAGTETSARRHATTMWEVGKHLVVWRSQGMVMNKTDVIKRLDEEKILGDSTAYKRWNEIEAIISRDSATLLYCKKGVGSSFRPSSKKASPKASSASDASSSGDPANNKPDPDGEGTPEPPHQTDDRASASDGTAEHAAPHGFRIVDGSNVGEGDARQPIFFVVRNSAHTEYAQAA